MKKVGAAFGSILVISAAGAVIGAAQASVYRTKSGFPKAVSRDRV